MLGRVGRGIQITVLGSGSAGNCTMIETPATALLIDAGLSARQIAQRLQAIGRDLADMDGIVLTHEHSDHTRAIGVLCKAHPLAVFANRLTAEAVTDNADWNGNTRISWRLFPTGGSFEIGDLFVESFSVSHDAQDPVGFTIRHQETGLTIGVVTDLGHATKLVTERIRVADAVVVESNHDVKLLQDDPNRPWSLKQRIMSRHGHLSNDDAATLIREIASSRLRHVCLAHLSRDCNRPELARRAVTDKLRPLGADHITVTVSSQDTPTATLSL